MNLFRKLANRTTPIDETALHYIWLSLACGFASASARELISAYHGAGAVYAQEDFSDRAGLSDALRKRLLEKDLTDAREIYKACREKDVGILTYESDLYPSRLRTLTNPPAVLYYRGRITNLDCEPCVAVVGTRSVSRYGEEVTDWFGYELAKSGAFVVSGLAKGADGIAHRAALRAGGSTVAVLGTAIDRVYPVQNEGLFSEIESKGLILSEYYPGCTTSGASFPERNRIISGISLCTVVTEAGMTSGALITARSAIAQNRDVYAVPGSIFVPGSDGTNHLIRGGVECVTCPARYSKNTPRITRPDCASHRARMRMSAALRARNARRRCPRVRRPLLRRPTACRQAKSGSTTASPPQPTVWCWMKSQPRSSCRLHR